jgi:hypothetical protein
MTGKARSTVAAEKASIASIRGTTDMAASIIVGSIRGRSSRYGAH